MPNDKRPKTGAEALELLKEGNARYVDSLSSTDPSIQKRPELVSDQDPFAIFLGAVRMRAYRSRLYLTKVWVIYSSFVSLVMWLRLHRLGQSSLLLRRSVPNWWSC